MNPWFVFGVWGGPPIADVVSGCIVAVDIYQPGRTAGHVYTPANTGALYQGGKTEGQAGCQI